MRGLMSFLSGALVGGLVGASLALLFAPTAGEDLISQMQDQAQRIEAEVKQAAVSRRSELEHQLAVLRAPQQPNAS